MSDTIIVNTKPSNRALDNFKRLCPEASFLGRKWRSKVTQFSVPLDVWEQRKEQLSQYASKAREQKKFLF